MICNMANRDIITGEKIFSWTSNEVETETKLCNHQFSTYAEFSETPAHVCVSEDKK